VTETLGHPVQPETTRKRTRLAIEIDRFVRSVDGLADTLPLITTLLFAARKKFSTELDEFEKNFATVRVEDGLRYVTVETEHTWTLKKLTRRRQKAYLAERTVPRSFVVSIVSLYDAFLGTLLRELFLMEPGLLAGSERTLTFSQLSEFSDLGTAKEFVLEKEIESVLRESHADQFGWMESKFKVELRKGLESWPTFIEVTERRNLFVHTGGVVSRQYLQVCGRHNVPLADVALGKELVASLSYFDAAYKCIFEIAVKLAHVLWRKVKPEDRAEADDNLNMICYELLQDERYDLAKRLLDFATETLKKFSSEQARRFFVINRAQAYKWSGDNTAAQKILDAEDWSASSDVIQLGERLLRDDYAEALALMKRLGNVGMEKSDYRDWPVFNEFRKRPEFAATFEAIYGEPLEQATPVESEEAEVTPDN
jgi:hypothetical protein